MLRLRELQLFNWGYAPFQVPLPVGNVTLLQGRNGSGKTTYLSAIALLLGVRHLPKRQALDKFIYPGAEWAFIRGTADNAPLSGRRPFDTVFATLEDRVTLACLVERKEGSWQRRYFIVPGQDFSPDPERMVDKRYQFSQTDYRQMLAHVGVRDALLNLLELGLYGLREASRDSVSRFQFFLKLVGSEEIRQNYESARKEWWQQQQQTRHLEDRLRQEEESLARMAEQIKALRRRRELKVRLERDKVLADHARRRDLQQQLLTHQANRADASTALDDLARKIAATEREQAALEAEYQAWQAQYQAWRSERDAAEKAAAEARQVYTRADLLCQQQQAKVDAWQALPPISFDQAAAALQQAEEADFEAREGLKRIQQEQAALTDEQARLLANETPLPADVQTFVNALQAGHISHLLLANVVEITEPRWQYAVEGALGGERFTVIVEDEPAQIQAKELGQQLNYRYYVSPPNTRTGSPPVADSLWLVTQVADDRARGWVYGRLAHIQRVANVSEGHRLAGQGVTTITDQAYLQEKRGGRSVRPASLVCGQTARQSRLRDIQARLTSLVTELAAAQDRSRLAQTQLAEARQAAYQAKELLKLPQEKELLAALRAEVETARAQVERLAAAYQAIKGREEEWNSHRDTLVGGKARLTDRRRSLDSDLLEQQRRLREAETQITRLERQVNTLTPQLSPLDDETQRIFDSEALSAEQYHTRLLEAESELDQLPAVDYDDITEEMYESQQSTVRYLRTEVGTMRQREQEHRRLFDDALQDFREHIHQLFGQGMNRAFKTLCSQADARGEISVLDGEDNWGLQVKIGFHEKPSLLLENAPLSQGQEVMTGLFLVLAALQTVRATPILLLDELMSTLDEVNAPLVLSRLQTTGAQCFVATPHVRPQADAIADAIWALQPRQESQPYAPPVGVLTRRGE